jgi:hypothetical protein
VPTERLSMRKTREILEQPLAGVTVHPTVGTWQFTQRRPLAPSS